MKNRLFEKHTEELEKKSREHESHLHAARLELERAVEISKQKVNKVVLQVLLVFNNFAENGTVFVFFVTTVLQGMQIQLLAFFLLLGLNLFKCLFIYMYW